jgi:hypothetical protein
MTAMDLTIHQAYLPQDDPDEVRNDVGYRGMRWITVGPAGQPGTSIRQVATAPSGRSCRRRGSLA